MPSVCNEVKGVHGLQKCSNVSALPFLMLKEREGMSIRLLV